MSSLLYVSVVGDLKAQPCTTFIPYYRDESLSSWIPPILHIPKLNWTGSAWHPVGTLGVNSTQISWKVIFLSSPQLRRFSLTGLWRSVEAAQHLGAVRSGPEIAWRRWRDVRWWVCLTGSLLRFFAVRETLCASPSSPVPAPVSISEESLSTS